MNVSFHSETSRGCCWCWWYLRLQKQQEIKPRGKTFDSQHRGWNNWKSRRLQSPRIPLLCIYIYIFLWRLQHLMAFHFSSPWLSRHSFFSWHYASHPSDGLSAVWLIWLWWAIRTNSPFGVSRNKLTATASLFIIRISRFCGKNDRSEHVTQKKTKAYRVSWYLLGLRVSF